MPGDTTGSPGKLRVFLCHAKEDKPAVRDLYRKLAGDGFQPWLDEEDLLPGEKWAPAIRKAVRECDVVLVCLSTRSTRQGFVQKEIAFALDAADEHPEGTIYLIPLRLEECDVPDRLREWHWADLRDDAGYERLVRSLRKRAADLGPAPAGSDAPHRVVDPLPLAPRQPAWPPPSGHAIGDTIINPTDGASLLWVPAGEFLMGSNDGYPDEAPQRSVTLDGYWSYTTPVTAAQYHRFCKAAVRQMPEPSSWGWEDDHPVVSVSWNDARAYCEWAGVALPTEAQWEKAARGTDGRAYPWGNEWDPAMCANAVGRTMGGTTPVGRYPDGASPYGCLDVAGNVWEWCADWFAKAHYPQSPERNPTGPSSGVSRVLRGGSWSFDNSHYFRCAYRNHYDPDNRYSDFGFRAARTGA